MAARLTACLCLAVLAAMCLGPGQAAWRVRAASPAVLAPGHELALTVPMAKRARARVVLDVQCAEGGDCAKLALRTGDDRGRRAPRASSSDRVSFGPLSVGQPLLVNIGDRPLKIETGWWDNSTAHNSGFPRFALLWSAPTGPPLSWTAILVLLAAAMAWQFAGPTAGRIKPWLAALPSVLGLAVGALAWAGGMRLVLGWDAFLLLAAIGPLGLRAAGMPARAARANREDEEQSKGLAPLAALGLLLAAVVAAWLLVPQPPEPPAMDQVYRHKVRQAQPDYIIMGNSMAGTRINPALLARLAHGRVFDLHRNQSYATTWYVIFKNVVVASGVKPKAVFLFFREARLTNPWRGPAATGTRRLVAKYSRADEPLVERVIYGRGVMRRELWDLLEPFYELEQYGRRGRAVMGEGALRLAQPVADMTGFRISEIRRVWDRMVNHRFRLSLLKASARGFRTLGYHQDLDFRSSLAGSFLPDMVRLAKQRGIKLVLVRIQSRPNGDGSPPDTEAMKQYLRGLKQYAAAEGVGFYDFTGHPGIGPQMYGNRDHIARKHRDEYTRLFHQALRRYF